MSWKSAEEVEAEYLADLGPDLGAVFHALYLDLTWAHWRWRQYRVLFGDKDARIDLINGAAPVFFLIVQDVFFEDTLLAISRLAGPAETFKKANLAVTRLPALKRTPELRQAIDALVETAVEAAALAKDWRNRHRTPRSRARAGRCRKALGTCE